MRLQVTDSETGQGIPSATIQGMNASGIPRSSIYGTVTDREGIAEWDATEWMADGIVTLVISSVGYGTRTIPLSTGTSGEITLDKNYQDIDEVIVEGKRNKSNAWIGVLILVAIVVALYFYYKYKA